MAKPKYFDGLYATLDVRAVPFLTKMKGSLSDAAFVLSALPHPSRVIDVMALFSQTDARSFFECFQERRVERKKALSKSGKNNLRAVVKHSTMVMPYLARAHKRKMYHQTALTCINQIASELCGAYTSDPSANPWMRYRARKMYAECVAGACKIAQDTEKKDMPATLDVLERLVALKMPAKTQKSAQAMAAAFMPNSSLS